MHHQPSVCYLKMHIACIRRPADGKIPRMHLVRTFKDFTNTKPRSNRSTFDHTFLRVWSGIESITLLRFISSRGPTSANMCPVEIKLNIDCAEDDDRTLVRLHVCPQILGVHGSCKYLQRWQSRTSQMTAHRLPGEKCSASLRRLGELGDGRGGWPG